MTNKIVTNKEINNARKERIVARYKTLQQANPTASHNEICKKIASEIHRSTQRIDQIIRETGNYEKKQKINE